MKEKRLNNKDWKGKAKVDTSDEDVQELEFFPKEGTRILEEEGNGSKNKDPEKEPIVEGSSSDALENRPQDQPSPRAAEGYPLVSQLGPTQERPRMRSYSCRYCTKLFSSAQALGGHQNSHKHERELAKRQRMHAQGCTPYNYGRLPNSLTLGVPRLPSYNPNNFTRPPLGFPYSSMPGFPNTQYPRSTTGLPLGHFGLSSGMLFRNTQLPERHRMTNPYIENDNHIGGSTLNSMGITGGREGGVLGSFLGPHGINNRSMWSDFNSMGMGGSGEGGSNTRGLLDQNSRLRDDDDDDGFEAVGTSSDNLFRALFGVSQGEINVSDGFQDSVEVCDGTIDLLSRVGMDSGIDGESNGGGSNGEMEANDGALDLLSNVGVIDLASDEEDNGDGSS